MVFLNISVFIKKIWAPIVKIYKIYNLFFFFILAPPLDRTKVAPGADAPPALPSLRHWYQQSIVGLAYYIKSEKTRLIRIVQMNIESQVSLYRKKQMKSQRSTNCQKRIQ